MTQKRFIFGKDATDLCNNRHYTDNPVDPIICRIENQPILAIDSWENISANDNATSRMGARIVSKDGVTVRQTLFSVANFGPTTEFNTANRNKTFADSDVVTGTYTTVDGDRLVIEIGHSDASGTTIACTTNWGESAASDLLEDETDTAGDPWIEFSNTITFQNEDIVRESMPVTAMVV